MAFGLFQGERKVHFDDLLERSHIGRLLSFNVVREVDTLKKTALLD